MSTLHPQLSVIPPAEVGEAIASVMREESERFRFVCRVKRAFSASMRVVANSDALYFERGSAAGAALRYSVDPATGEVSVDAKMLGALAAGLASQAEVKGVLPGLLARALVDPEVEVFVQHTPIGVRFSPVKPPNAEGEWRLLDSASQVLSLSAAEAIELGVGQWWEQRAELVDGDWRCAGAIGSSAIEDSRVRCKELNTARGWMSRLPTFLEQARSTRAATEFLDYTYVTTSWYDSRGRLQTRREMSEDSQALWNKRQRAYSAAWDSLRLGSEDIIRVLRRYDNADRPGWLSNALEQASDMYRIAAEKLNQR